MWLEQRDRGEEREEGRADRAQGQVLQGLGGQGRTFAPREVGPLEDCEQRRAGPDSELTGALWPP